MLSFNRFQLHALTQQNVDSKDTRTRILILAKMSFPSIYSCINLKK
uniref:Uncharacterized protein n=1 Tax=Anguilla anguilla TaxID=7936 RepID=A0A0E9VTL9_ANGAN